MSSGEYGSKHFCKCFADRLPILLIWLFMLYSFFVYFWLFCFKKIIFIEENVALVFLVVFSFLFLIVIWTFCYSLICSPGVWTGSPE